MKISYLAKVTKFVQNFSDKSFQTVSVKGILSGVKGLSMCVVSMENGLQHIFCVGEKDVFVLFILDTDCGKEGL